MARRSDNRLVEITAAMRMETLHAYLLNDGKREAWFAKSLTEDNRDGTYTVPEWLAKKEGFI